MGKKRKLIANLSLLAALILGLFSIIINVFPRHVFFNIDIDADNCGNINIITDSVKLGMDEKFGVEVNPKKGGLQTAAIPVQSKYIEISLCENSIIKINKFDIVHNQSIYPLSKLARNYWICLDCEIEWEGDLTLIHTGDKEAKLVISSIINEYPKSLYFEHLLTRYISYFFILFFVFVIFLSIAGDKKIIYQTAFFSLIFLFIIFLKKKDILELFPPPEISNQKIVGGAHFSNIPIYADMVIFMLQIAIPICIFIFLLIWEKLTKNE